MPPIYRIAPVEEFGDRVILVTGSNHVFSGAWPWNGFPYTDR